jgi:hypothetical protein
MQYLLLIYENESRFAGGYDPAELKEYRANAQEFASFIQAGKALEPTRSAKTVRVREGKRLVTDGPFAETKEQLGGFYLIEAPSVEKALEIAARIPAARFGCIEVRPIHTFAT